MRNVTLTSKKEVPVISEILIEVPKIAKVTMVKGVKKYTDYRIFRESMYNIRRPEGYTHVGWEQVTADTPFEVSYALMQDALVADEDIEREAREEMSYHQRNLVIGQSDLPNLYILPDADQRKLKSVMHTSSQEVVLNGEVKTKHIYQYYLGELLDQPERDIYHVIDTTGDPTTNMQLKYTSLLDGGTSHEADLFRSADRSDSGLRRKPISCEDDVQPHGIMPIQNFLQDRLHRWGSSQCGTETQWLETRRQLAIMLHTVVATNNVSMETDIVHHYSSWLYGVCGKKTDDSETGITHTSQKMFPSLQGHQQCMGIWWDMKHDRHLAKLEGREAIDVDATPTYNMLTEYYNSLVELQKAGCLQMPHPTEEDELLAKLDYQAVYEIEGVKYDTRAWYSLDPDSEYENNDYQGWDDPENVWIEEQEIQSYDHDTFLPLYSADHAQCGLPTGTGYYDIISRSLSKDELTLEIVLDTRKDLIPELSEYLDSLEHAAKQLGNKLNTYKTRYVGIDKGWADKIMNIDALSFYSSGWASKLPKFHRDKVSADQATLLWNLARYIVKGSMEPNQQRATEDVRTNKDSLHFYALKLFGDYMHQQEPENYPNAMPKLVKDLKVRSNAKGTRPEGSTVSETMKTLADGGKVEEYSMLEFLNPMASIKLGESTVKQTFSEFLESVWKRYSSKYILNGKLKVTLQDKVKIHAGFVASIDKI